MTGSAFKPWGEIEPEKMSVTSGTDSLLVVGDPDGRHAVRCKECFSLLNWTGYEGKIRIPYGTLIGRADAQAGGAYFRRLKGFVA